MLAVLSPAKSLNFSPAPPALPHSTPALIAETAELAKVTKPLLPSDLKRLMSISDALADLNHARFQAFGDPRPGETAKQAALAFSGDTYIGLDAATMDQADLTWAQDHVRILSGLYGVLRPLDLIEPYRLEMGTRLENPRGKDLYAFWAGLLGQSLDTELDNHAAPVLVNLASTEYFKAVEAKSMRNTVITPVFHEERAGTSRVIGLMAKRARGMMARWMVDHRLDDPEGLKDFSAGGYRFRADRSDASTWVFTRPQP